MPRKSIARDPEDALRRALDEARLAAYELRAWEKLQALDSIEDDGTFPPFRVRLKATEHARWVADLIDHGKVIAGRLDARGVLCMFFVRSSPISDHIEARWRTREAADRDIARLVRLLEANPATDGEELVKRAMRAVDWPKPSNLFSARDQKTRRKSSGR